MRFTDFYKRYERLLMEDIVDTTSFQTDIRAWDPARQQPILIQVKHGSNRGGSSLVHEISHFMLSHDGSGQTYSPADDGWVSLPSRARLHLPLAWADSPEDIGSRDPAWLSWIRRILDSRLRPLDARITAGFLSGDHRVRAARAIAKPVPRRLSLTFVTELVARSYRDGLLLLASSKLAAQRRMLARLVSAFAHQPTAPAFLLVMIAAAQNYGHRSEPDHHSRLASVQKLPKRKGAACLVT